MTPSAVFLHNDTSETFEYKISADIDPQHGLNSHQGTLAKGEVVEALVHSQREISHVELTITQDGKVRSRIYSPKELPQDLRRGGWSFIKVSDKAFTIGNGSGNWGADLQQRFGIFSVPCIGIACLVVIVGIFVKILRPRQEKQNLLPNSKYKENEDVKKDN